MKGTFTTMYRIVKTRYEPSYDRTKKPGEPGYFRGYYKYRVTTDYREHKNAVTSAIAYAEKANRYAERFNSVNPVRHAAYYAVEVSEVEVTEVGTGPSIIPDCPVVDKQ